MLANIPKISVLVITYNQEKVISRAIDSLVSQKEYIYEICVSDDCSNDKTMDILQEYSNAYPGLFKLKKNNPNVGIFENIESTWNMPTGDVIYQLSGDDECGKEWFKIVVDYIAENRIDYKNELFGIYGDYLIKYPNGFTFRFKNNLIKHDNVVQNTLLGLIGVRSCCYSKHVLDRFCKVSQGRSHIVETAQDIQIPLFTEKFYYIPNLGNIYHAGEGVSVHLEDKDLLVREGIVPYAFTFLSSQGYNISFKEKIFCQYNIAIKKGQRLGGLKYKILALFCFVLIYTYPFSVSKKALGKTWFSMKRRFYSR